MMMIIFKADLKLDLYKVFAFRAVSFSYFFARNETTDFRLLNKCFLTVLFLPNYSLTASTSYNASF